MLRRKNQQILQGFTLLELLVVIAVLLVLGTIVIRGFVSFQTHQALELTTKEVRQMFEVARSQTLASVNDQQYGVHISSGAVTLFVGEEYIEGNPSNSVFELDSRVVISEVNLTPETDEILFERGTGEPSSSGHIELSLVTKPTVIQMVTITSTGIIDSNE